MSPSALARRSKYVVFLGGSPSNANDGNSHAQPRLWSRALGGFLALGVILLTAACDGGSTIAAARLNQLVLTEQDMPGFRTFYNGAQVRLDNQGTNRVDAARFGREGGWISRFHPAVPTTTSGPLVVESRGVLFKTSAVAET